MFNNPASVFILVLFLYSAFFTVYYVIITAAALIPAKRRIRDNIRGEYNNLIVIIYSHNNEKTISSLLEQLNRQDYPEGKYQVHIILDNCTDGSSNKLEFIGGAKLWRLADNTPLGKDKAVSWVLDNIMTYKKTDAYVFLGADRIVKTDFLANINNELQKHSVLTGAEEVFLEDAGFYDNVWANVNEYNASIMKKGRARLGLASPINSNITVIKREVLEKVKCIDFKDADSELKYSFLLTKINCPPIFAPSVKTYVSSNNYILARPDFLFKVSLFFHCFSLKALADFKFTEFLFFLFKPNPVVLAAMITAAAVYSIDNYFLNNFPWAVFLAVILAVTFMVSIYKADLYYLKQLVYLFLYPFCTLADTLGEMTLIKKLFKHIKDKTPLDNKTEKISVPVCVTNGRSVFPCTLDIISSSGMKKAVFRYKNKKQETPKSYDTITEAVKSISEILDLHGFRMKICSSCAYFTPKIDGGDRAVKGYCSRKAVSGEEALQPPETFLWSSCEYFIPQEVNNVIDILKFIKK